MSEFRVSEMPGVAASLTPPSHPHQTLVAIGALATGGAFNNCIDLTVPYSNPY